MIDRPWGLLLSAALLLQALPTQAQPPGMPDPRRMSGIARVDGGLEAGAISVRTLLGTFAQPAVDTEVILELFSKDRRSLGTQTQKSDAAGRVTFRQLSSRYPDLAYAIAKATLGGAIETSRPIMVDPRAGSRVLLVKGASAMQGSAARPGMPQAPASPGAGGHGGGHAGGKMGIKAPALCRPNPLDTHPKGTLVVGVIEFSAKGALQGRPDQTVVLTVSPPGEEPRTLEAVSDLNGRATFTGLTGAGYPEGTQFRVQAKADPKGGGLVGIEASARVAAQVAPKHVKVKVFKPDASTLISESFVWTEAPKVVLLTKNCVKIEQNPVNGLEVTLYRHSMTGDKSASSHKVDAKGEVLIPIKNHHDGDFYSLRAIHQGAPFRTSFFQPPEHAGVYAEIPVYDVTSDASLLRSAVQFEFYSREDNMAQVNRFYQVFVPGKRAFWQPGLKISGAQDTRWFKVVPAAEAHLKHDEGAPFATLAAPILPGKAVDLSVAFGVPHRGALDLAWTAPFPLERALGVTSGEMRFAKGAQPPSKTGNHKGAQKASLSEIDVGSPGARLCQDKPENCKDAAGKATIDLEVAGFAYEKPWLVWAGGGVAGLALLGMGMGWWLGRREDPLNALLAQRDDLWVRLQKAKQDEQPEQVKQLTAQLNALYHRIGSLDSKSE